LITATPSSGWISTKTRTSFLGVGSRKIDSVVGTVSALAAGAPRSVSASSAIASRVSS
jgi:hypothetical protein